jgi:hypothetical protein
LSKRLSASGPKPRPHFAFPGYPTVAAAGLYLCLSGGCSRDLGVNDTSNTGGTTTGGTTSTSDVDSPGGHLTGAVMPTYNSGPPAPRIPDAAVVVPPTPDAAAPDILPPAPDGDDTGRADHEDATITPPDSSDIP